MLALSLGCLSGGSGVMAQSAGWDAIYNQTQTSSTNWTKLDAGSTSGRTLGSGSATTYYYIDRNLDFTNTNGSGLTITGTVYLYVPAGYTLFCQGSNANGRIGAGAGIELPSGNTLYIIGGGSVTAKGGLSVKGYPVLSIRNASVQRSKHVSCLYCTAHTDMNPCYRTILRCHDFILHLHGL